MCVQIRIDTYRYVQICIDMYMYVQICIWIDVYRYVWFFLHQTSVVVVFSSQNLHNPVRMSQLLLKSLRYVQIKYFDYTQLQQILRTQSLCSIVTYTIQNHHVTVTLHRVILTYTIKNIIYGYSYIYYPKYYIQLQLHILSNIIYSYSYKYYPTNKYIYIERVTVTNTIKNIVYSYTYIYYRINYIQLQLHILSSKYKQLQLFLLFKPLYNCYSMLQLHKLSKTLYIVVVVYTIQNIIYDYSMLQLHILPKNIIYMQLQLLILAKTF